MNYCNIWFNDCEESSSVSGINFYDQCCSSVGTTEKPVFQVKLNLFQKEFSNISKHLKTKKEKNDYFYQCYSDHWPILVSFKIDPLILFEKLDINLFN